LSFILREQNEKTNIEQKLAAVSTELIDLQLELNVNQEKQNELLAFTSKLTEKNTSLQSENAAITEKLLQVQADLERVSHTMNQSNDSVKSQVDSLIFYVYFILYKKKLIIKLVEDYFIKNSALFLFVFLKIQPWLNFD
jgi:predicted nuclease with TOPRIM domain